MINLLTSNPLKDTVIWESLQTYIGSDIVRFWCPRSLGARFWVPIIIMAMGMMVLAKAHKPKQQNPAFTKGSAASALEPPIFSRNPDGLTGLKNSANVMRLSLFYIDLI